MMDGWEMKRGAFRGRGLVMTADILSVKSAKGLLIDRPLPVTRLVWETRSDGENQRWLERTARGRENSTLGQGLREKALETRGEGTLLLQLWVGVLLGGDPGVLRWIGRLGLWVHEAPSDPLTLWLHSHISRMWMHTQVCRLSFCLIYMAELLADMNMCPD